MTTSVEILRRKQRIMEEEVPELTSAQIYFSRKMNEKIDLMKALQRSFIHGEVDLAAMRQLTNSSWPEDLDDISAIPCSYYRQSKNVLLSNLLVIGKIST